MSRGPGRWQRRILAALEECDHFYLVALLPDGYSAGEYNALHRAATRLCRDGKVGAHRYLFGVRKTVITRPGARIPDRKTLDRVSVGVLNVCHDCNTY